MQFEKLTSIITLLSFIFISACGSGGPQNVGGASTTTNQLSNNGQSSVTSSSSTSLASSSPQTSNTTLGIRLNQVGLLPNINNGATVVSESKTPLHWQLKDKTGAIFQEGETHIFGFNKDSGEQIHTITLAPLTKTDEGFNLQIGNVKSFPFAIKPSIYKTLKTDILELFYHIRSDIPIEAQYVSEAYARPAGHPLDLLPCIKGVDMNGSVWEGCTNKVDTTGGWYDAGDLGKDVVNGGFSLWILQNMAERNLQITNRPDPFADGTLNIPENHNQISDLLDQSRVEMEFFLKMQAPERTFLKIPLGDQSNQINKLQFMLTDVSGMVRHQAGNITFTDFVPPNLAQINDRYVFPPSTAATLNMAATAAQAARLWKNIDPVFAARCLTAAETAWAAAKRVPNAYVYLSFDGVGHYGDIEIGDEFYWAATELLITTGKKVYETEVRNSKYLYSMPHSAGEDAVDFSWLHSETAATLGLALTDTTSFVPQDLREKARSAVIASADTLVETAKQQGYGVPYHRFEYFWGSNGIIASRGITLGVAYDFSKNQKYLEGTAAVMDYLLGRNPMNQTFVSGYGSRPMTGTHHRFWIWVHKERGVLAPPGILIGGPNSTDFIEQFSQSLQRKCVRQTCYVDNEMAYTMNEVAINYWAPFFWVAAYLDDVANNK